MTWEAGAGGLADGYNLELDGSVYTTTETFKVLTLDAGIHNWRVRAFNVWGASDYTDAWNFEIVGPGVPTLISPSDGAVTSSSTTFVWEDGTGGVPTGYIFMWMARL
jgi:predicted phage tail protein